MNQSININSWVNEYTDALFKRALFSVNQNDLAEDLVQETFISAYKNIKKFRGDSNPKTWLMSILNNKIMDYYRSVSRKKTDSFSQLSEQFDDAGNWLDRNINAMWSQDNQLLDNELFVETLNLCMKKLPSDWKMVLTAKYLDQRKAKEICKGLGISPSNYWQQIHRAKLQLKQCLEKNYEL